MGEHINTFNKGMTSDVNVIYQPDGTYRYMKNCQLISQDGNNYVIKDCLGNVQKFTINRRYDTDYTKNDVYPMCIGFISFVDQLVVFSTNAQSYTGSDRDPVGGYGEIGIINYNNYREGIEPNVVYGNYNDGYVPLYHHIDLNFSMLKQIEGFAYEENSSSKQVYWTDNFNEPRVFNVADPIFTTYYGAYYSNPLSATVGEQYMVVEGAVTYNGVDYGPGLTAGNIFTTSGGITVFTDLTTPTPIAKVIKYYPYQLLNFTPSRSMGNIKFNSYGSGNKYCGAKMYFYRLSNSTNGINTSWSYGSNPISVETDNSLVATPANPYFDLTGGGTSTTLLNSGKSVKIDIDNIDTSFDTIQVACAEFDQTLDVPRTISEVYSGTITGSSMIIEDIGSVLSTLTLSDITLFPASILRCKTITTNKNYILIGNTQERQEFEYDTSGITSAEIKGTFPVHEADKTLCNNVLTYTSVAPTPSVNPTFIIEGCNYVVTSIAGGNVVYNGNPYIVGEVILGTATTAITIPAGSQVRPCVSINKYTAINSTTAYPERPNYIQLYDLTAGNVSWSYRDPAVSALKKGYWGKEKYRFAILFYDKKGNPYYAKHITDFTFSDPETTPIIEQKTTGSYDYYFLNQRAISFSNIVIPKEIVDVISGFSIVRAERDKRIITEGFLMQVGDNGVDCIPIAGPYARLNSQYTGSLTQYMTLICPDRLAGYTMPNYTTGSSIEGSFWLRATEFDNPPTSSVFMKSIDQSDQVESRYFNQYVTSDGITRLNKIIAIDDVNEYDTVTNFGSSNRNYKNFTWFSPVQLSDVENSCVTGIPGSLSSLDDKGAVGGARTILEFEDTLLYRGGLIQYGDLATVTGASVDKLVVDVVIDNTNQYGGNSEAALANTLYISTGHFQPINSTVIAETNDTNNPLSYNNLTFNNVDVWGGDCYTCLVDYGHSLYSTDFTVLPYNGTNSWGIKFPMQCNVNYDLRRGRTVANNKMGYAAGMAAAPPVGVVYKDTFNNIRLESFEYNKGYSSDGNIFNYPALPINFKNIGEFKFRVRYAGVKFPNELINSFRTFLTNDYKDVDGQGGEINNIRTKDGRVIVWQNKLVSTVPILERQLLTGLSGAPTTLGTGGVVDRYDPLNSYFGNQHQQGLTQTEYGFAWFDMRRKAFMIMDINAGIIEVSKRDGLKGFFDEVFLEASVTGMPSDIPVLNSPNYLDTSSRPLVGLGITGVYDPKFKTTYLTFKFKLLENIFEDNYDGEPKDFTIAYNHVDKFFVGFFDWTPSISHNHNQIVLSVNNPKSSKYYGPYMNDGVVSDFEIGDTLASDNVEYMVISPITIDYYPLSGDQAPDYPNSTYFKKVNDTSQIWVHNQEISTSSTEYQYNKFFGKVVDNEVHVIVNPQSPNPFSVLRIEQGGNLVNVTEISTSGDVQSAIDANISTGNRFYRNIWDRICSSLPLSSTGRVVDKYLKIRFYKKNWTTDPTVLTGSTRIFTWLKSFFEEKR